MIQVIAIVTTKPGKRDEVLAAFKDVVPEVLAEDGCIEYAPMVDTVEAAGVASPFGDDSFVVCEKWASLDHLMVHAGAPHMLTYREKVKDLTVDTKLHILSPVD